ncbi:MAG TPA: DoxX family membrane protein [Chloroflexi bacterium]|nr:DoxX family membrane protein [Chloroflexota bacterium]
MSMEMSSDLLNSLLRPLLGAIFLIAGSKKLWKLSTFSQVVSSYNLLPENLARPFAKTIPWLEFVVGLCLVTGIFVQTAATLALILLLVFTTAIGMALMQGREIDCGCFGTIQRGRLKAKSLIRNVILITIVVFVLVYPYL